MNRNKLQYGTNKKEDKRMAVLTKPINKISVIKNQDSSKFVHEFNKNKVSEDFLKSCKKAADLFAKKGN